MKKRLLLLVVFAAALYSTYAQNTAPTPKNGEISFNGYQIRLQKLPAGGYAYDILSGERIIVHQDKNPFTGSAIGLKNREDAVKTAKWQVIHINPVSKQVMLDKQLLPAEVAKQLNIETN